MEMEHNKSLPFLDVWVSRKPDGSLEHTVYRKPTHTDLYLHAKTEYHPAQKRAVLTTLIWRARSICDTESLEGEKEYLKKAFRQNGYSNGEINQALYPRHKPQQQCEEPTSVAMLPYQHYVTNKISRLLAKRNIKTIHIPDRKSIHMLSSVKNKLGLKVPGIYRIPYECGKVYVGQTSRAIENRCKEHKRHIHLGQPGNSAVAEHSIETGHNIDFNNIMILEKVTGYMNHLVKEAIEICLHPNNFNRDGGLNLSQAWQPVTSMLKQSGEPISKQGQAMQALDSTH
jgi:hypothetical protein